MLYIIISVVSHKTVVILHTLEKQGDWRRNTINTNITYFFFITTFTWETRRQGRTEPFGM